MPENKLNLLGKAVNAFLLKPVGPIGEIPSSIKQDTSVLYGQYLANNVANCRGCHTDRDLMTGAFTGKDYAGGLKMEAVTDSGTYSITTPNLTPDPTGRIKGVVTGAIYQSFQIRKTDPAKPYALGAIQPDER